MSASSEINKIFCRVLLKNSKEDLRVAVGKKKAAELLRNNMDVCGHPRRGYFLHWVRDGVLLTEDIHKDEDCDNIDHARAEAIEFLLEKLCEKHPAIKAVMDKWTAEKIKEIEGAK